GASSAKIDSGSINSDLQSLGFSSATTSTDEGSVAYKGVCGIQLQQIHRDRRRLFRFRHVQVQFDRDATGNFERPDQVKRFQPGRSVELSIRTELQCIRTRRRAKREDQGEGTGSIFVIEPDSSETKTSWDAGVGVGYQFANGIGLRAEWER